VLPGPFLPAPWTIRTRAMSWRLEPDHHPYLQDSARSLLALQAQSLRACPGYTWLERRALQAWLLGIVLMPSRMAFKVALANTSCRLRRWVGLFGGREQPAAWSGPQA